MAKSWEGSATLPIQVQFDLPDEWEGDEEEFTKALKDALVEAINYKTLRDPRFISVIPQFVDEEGNWVRKPQLTELKVTLKGGSYTVSIKESRYCEFTFEDEEGEFDDDVAVQSAFQMGDIDYNDFVGEWDWNVEEYDVEVVED